jgi:hypothetical protein
VDVHTFIKKVKKYKQTLSACQKADGNHFLEQKKVLMVEIMQQGTTMMNVYLLMYGAEPFLRSCQLCSQSENSQQF